MEWTPTAGEIGALLLEARRVKDEQPVYNRQLRREGSLCAWKLAEQPQARPLLSLVRAQDLQPREFGRLFGVYRSKNQAHSALRELAEAHGLCLQALGLESGKGRCFGHQIGHCKGVCCGQEKPELHYLRLQLAMAQQKLQVWPFEGPVGLREHDAENARTDIHLFDQWCHLATVQNEDELADALSARRSLAFDLDTYRLTLKHLLPGGKASPGLIKFAPLRPSA